MPYSNLSRLRAGARVERPRAQASVSRGGRMMLMVSLICPASDYDGMAESVTRHASNPYFKELQIVLFYEMEHR